MRTEDGRPVRLEDYRPTPYAIDEVDLAFALDPNATRVHATLAVRRRPDTPAGTSLVLDGDGLTLCGVWLDGRPMEREDFTATPDRFVLPDPPETFSLTLETRLAPEANTTLMGLYRSGAVYCTQCEAEGFRRMTYFLDRPDVLATYRVRIEAERDTAPVLLSNGNLLETGDLGEGRHYAVWHDPFPKPSYLFALVAGDLAVVQDTFTTRSGRTVDLRIYVEHGKEGRCGYAMDALKRAMRWDEEVFGREYDLDIFMIVAVSDFNMGAMENKGLNVFNDRYVLAEPAVATDQDYAGIEAVIAHEYFHNWTGNRITCRDWFQLCLKEGLTVFRDQEFSADQRSRPVKRISDVRLLRNHQFPEDAGPLAHPVRPDTYNEISNFYTATVYEKGAELVRVLKTVLGAAGFARGLDLYFERHDGQAVTIEDFLAAFADANGIDLSVFLPWYTQAGTPEVAVEEAWDEARRRYVLTIRQSQPDTPGQSDKRPLPIPVRLALLGSNGAEMTPERIDIERVNDPADGPVPDAAVRLAERAFGLADGGSDAGGPGAGRGTGAEPTVLDDPTGDRARRSPEMVLTLASRTTTAVFEGLPERPVPSLLRGFSAPVRLSGPAVDRHTRFLMAHDTDAFNRWQAIQTEARRWLVADATTPGGGATPADPAELIESLAETATAADHDPAFRALCLQLPSETEIAIAIGEDVDPSAVLAATTALKRAIADRTGDRLREVYEAHAVTGPYRPTAQDAGRRALRNAILDHLASGGESDPDAGRLAARQFETADNMTDRLAALAALTHHGHAAAAEALDLFYRDFEDEPLALDKWFSIQASAPLPGTLERVEALASHPKFAAANPNRIRALFGAFAQANPSQFNRRDGAGYRLIADVVLSLDAKNPQVAARLLSAFRSYRSLEPTRRRLAQEALQRVADAETLSSDTRDIVTRILSA